MSSLLLQIRHVQSGHEILPDHLADFESKRETLKKKSTGPVTDPSELSSFLTVHRTEGYLYCHLTKRMVWNDLEHAKLHVEGKLYRHKFYEWLRIKFAPKRDQLLSGMRMTRKLQEHGKIQKLRPGTNDENNILDKGFLRRRKYKRALRISKLVIMSFKPLDKK